MSTQEKPPVPTPKGFTYEFIYEPDMSRMVQALKIVLAMPDPRKKEAAQP